MNKFYTWLKIRAQGYFPVSSLPKVERRGSPQLALWSDHGSQPRPVLSRSFASLFLALSFLVFGAPSLWSQGSGLNLSALEDLPIQDSGRKKPFYTFAVETLQLIHGRTTWKDPASGQTWDAVDLFAAIWVEPTGWEFQPLVRVDNLALKEAIDLPATRKDRNFSLAELAENQKLRALLAEVQQVRRVNPQAELTSLQQEALRIGNRLNKLLTVLDGQAFAVVPPPDPNSVLWVSLPASADLYPAPVAEKLREAFTTMAQGYRMKDQSQFDRGFAALSGELVTLAPDNYADLSLIRLEHFYKQVHPFRLAWIAYLTALICLAVTWSWHTQLGYRIAWGWIGVGLFVQIAGYVFRILISGRAPVTNMYETVTWLALAVIIFAIVFEWIYKARYFFLGSLPVAIVALILADSAPAVLDRSIQPLVPVLRDNFWLTTHVLSINTSYAAFALAMAVAHIPLIMILRKKSIPNLLYTYIYRILQIGVLLLAIGTILGGVWANYSWGRFWDWDPKETWALISLLCYLLILHGRIAGWWAGFGLAVGSILAFQSILMAWYGVNFVLGKGLHSYGFGTGGFPVVATYTAVEVIFVATVCWLVWHRNHREFLPPDLPERAEG